MNRPRPFLRPVPDLPDLADDPDLTIDPDEVLVDLDDDGIPDRVTSSKPSKRAGRDVAVREGDELAARDEDGLLIPVDRQAARETVVATVLASAEDERKPVFPAWARDWLTFRSTVGRAARYGAHVAAWHAVRLPQHAAVVTCLRAPRGLYRGAGAVRRWVADSETAALQREAVRRGGHDDAKMHLALTRQRRARSAWRWSLLGLAVLAVVVLAALGRAEAPEWATWLAVAGVLLVLARLGTNPDQTMFGHAVISSEAPKLTSVVVAAALQNLGIAALTPTPKRPAAVQFVSEIARDGQGYRAEVDLPHGTTAAEVIERREKLSANLRRPLGAVWPERAPDAHEGRLVLWVGDRDLSKGGPTPWPLANKGACNFFRPFPFGTNPRGQEVTLELFEANVLVGSQPGQGKTATARVIASAVALDPLVEMWTHELKGSGDLDAFEVVSHRFVSGIRDESIGYAAHSLALLRRETERRTDALKAVPAQLRPDKKLTPEIAADRNYNLRPLVAIFDECQNLFTHATYGKQAAEDAEYIIKLGRAVGVVLVLITQRPDAKSLPGGISDNVSIRFCLSVNGQIANDMVLGTSSYQDGIRATQFRPRIDAGIGWLKGGGPAPMVVKAFYVDGPNAEAIAERALVLRTAAGTITGHAAGIDPEQPEDEARVVVDVLRVWTPGEDAVWSETLAARLAQLDPGRYAELNDERGATLLGAQLRARGIDVRDFHRKQAGKGITRKGVALVALEAYLQGVGQSAPAALEGAEDDR